MMRVSKVNFVTLWCTRRVNKYELIITKLDIIHRKKYHYSNSKNIIDIFSHMYYYINIITVIIIDFKYKEDETMKYVCDVCGWEYDEEKGYPEGGIAPGTKWEDVPEDFECPLCSVGKDQFSEE